VFAVGGLLAGIWMALTVGDGLATALESSLGAGWPAEVLGRALPVLACAGLAALAGWGVERTLKALKLGWLDRLAGFGLAAIAGVLLLAALVTSTTQLSPHWAEMVRRSKLVPFLVVWAGVVHDAAAEVADGPAAEPSAPTEATPADPNEL
jgi:membrane protein required for colicin V production